MQLEFKNLPKNMQLPHELTLLFDWIENEEENGTRVHFFEQTETVKKELDELYKTESNRLYIFAEAFDQFGLWLDDNNELKIIIRGINTSPSLFCVIGDAIDFIRILSIGYTGLSWFWNKEEFFAPTKLHVDKEFQDWVVQTFDTTIPKSASDIIGEFVDINDQSSNDAFWQWDRENNIIWEKQKYTVMVLNKAKELFPESDLNTLSFEDYCHTSMEIMFSIRFWLENSADIFSKEVIRNVKEFSSFCLNLKQPTEDEGCHIFTSFAVAFLEDLFNDKLYTLVPYIYDKKDFHDEKNLSFIKGYMSVSDEMYNKVSAYYSEMIDID